MRRQDRQKPSTRTQPAATNSSGTTFVSSHNEKSAQSDVAIEYGPKQETVKSKQNRIHSSRSQGALQMLSDGINKNRLLQAKRKDAGALSNEATAVQLALPSGGKLKAETEAVADASDQQWDVLIAILDQYHMHRADLEREVFQVEALKKTEESSDAAPPESLEIFRNQCKGDLDIFQERAKEWKSATLNESSGAVLQKRQSLTAILASLETEKAELDDTNTLTHRGKSKVEKDSKDEDWDVADAADAEGVQIALPTVEQFSKQTNAGIFARRDDVLKQIDSQLQKSNFARKSVYETEVWISKNEGQADVSPGLKEKMLSATKRCQKEYKGALDQLAATTNSWISQFKSDNSPHVTLRRGAVEALLLAIKAEQQMTSDQRVLGAEEKEAKDKAAAEVASRTLFTADEFKAEAKIWVIVPFTHVADVVAGLAAFHAISDKPGDDSVRLSKLEASQNVRSAADAANSEIAERKSHPGYKKGHSGWEIESTNIHQKALWKLQKQCANYFVHNQTEEEKAALHAKIKAARDAQNKAAWAHMGIPD